MKSFWKRISSRVHCLGAYEKRRTSLFLFVLQVPSPPVSYPLFLSFHLIHLHQRFKNFCGFEKYASLAYRSSVCTPRLHVVMGCTCPRRVHWHCSIVDNKFLVLAFRLPPSSFYNFSAFACLSAERIVLASDQLFCYRLVF